MAVIGAAAIGAVGSIGGAYISSQGGGGGGGGGFNLGNGLTANTPAFNYNLSGSNLTATRLDTTAQQAFLKRFPRSLSDLDSLRGQLGGAFGALTNAGVSAIGNQRIKAVGDLKDTLNRRKILGSSFANDAIVRTKAEFAQQEAQFRAQAKLAEMDTFAKLLDQENRYINSGLQYDLQESDLAATTISRLLGVANGNVQAAQARAAQGAENIGGSVSALGGQLFGAGLQGYLYGNQPNYASAGANAYYDVNVNPATAALF